MNNHYLTHLLGDQEKILLATHQHWFVLFKTTLYKIIVTLVFAVAVTVIWQSWLKNPLVVVAYLLLLIPIISLVHDILIWGNRDYIVTNLRVIQLVGLFNKNVTDSSLDKVNDVKMTQSFLGRMFGYGDIEILTASELGANMFKTIGNPIRFKTTMLNAKEKLEGHGGTPATGTPDIPTLIEKLDKLRQQGIVTDSEFQAKKADLLAKL